MMLILSLLIFLPKILCGFALVHWIWNKWDVPSVVLKVGIGFALGSAIGSGLFFGAILVGITPKIYSLVEFWGLLIIAILILVRLLPPLRTNWKFTRFSGRDYLSIMILGLGSGLLIYAFLHYSRMHPYGFEDAWSIWNYSARFLYRTNSPTALFDNHIYDRFHPDYPLGLSLNIAWGWFVLNQESTSLPIAFAFYIIASPALILWGSLKKWRGTLPALLATLIYLMNPNLKWSVGQMADGLLTVYMVSAIVMLYGYLRTSNPGLLLIAGLLSGFSAWTKNEGIVFLGIFLLVIILQVLTRVIKWDTIKWLVTGLLLPMLVVAAYKIAVRVPSEFLSGDNSATAYFFDFQRWQSIGRDFLVSTLHYGDWPVSFVLILLVYMILVGFDRAERPHQIWLLLIILGQLAGYFIIYLITPYDLAWHLHTSLDRVISHLFPMLFFWMFTALQPSQLASDHSLEQTASG